MLIWSLVKCSTWNLVHLPLQWSIHFGSSTWKGILHHALWSPATSHSLHAILCTNLWGSILQTVWSRDWSVSPSGVWPFPVWAHLSLWPLWHPPTAESCCCMVINVGEKVMPSVQSFLFEYFWLSLSVYVFPIFLTNPIGNCRIWLVWSLKPLF